MSTSSKKPAASKKGAIARVSGRRAEVLQRPLQNPVALEQMPAGYPEWLADVKARVRRVQLSAAQAANGELLMFYWDLGRDITEKMSLEGYGTKVVDRLSLVVIVPTEKVAEVSSTSTGPWASGLAMARSAPSSGG